MDQRNLVSPMSRPLLVIKDCVLGNQKALHVFMQRDSGRQGRALKAKTYNTRDSQMVTHSSTSRSVQCLCMAERTGCPVFTDLWSYVLPKIANTNISI
jgi:predicted metal-binding protein